MNDPAASLTLTSALLGIWGALNALQWLVDRQAWRGGTALGWDLQQMRRGRLLGSPVVARVYSHAGLTALAAVQLAAAIALIANRWPLAAMVALAGFALTTLLLSLRDGPDGADKMALVVASGSLVQLLGISIGEDRIVLAGVLWIGGQLAIAYFAAGASKLLLGPWRNGAALSAALSSFMWGHRWSARVVGHRPASVALAWFIMLAEVLFPLALFASPLWLGGILAGFLLFHLGIAVVMGLNTYPWAFLAAYPSVLLLGQWLRSAVGLG